MGPEQAICAVRCVITLLRRDAYSLPARPLQESPGPFGPGIPEESPNESPGPFRLRGPKTKGR